MSDHEADQARDRETEPAGFGAAMRAAREAAGLTRQQMHAHTRLELRIIEALEAEDLDILDHPTYARGYIRAYARVVEIDPAPLIDAYNALIGDRGETSWTPAPPARHEAAQGIRPWLITAVVGGVLLVLLLVWAFGGDRDVAPQVELSEEASVVEAGVSGEAPVLPALPDGRHERLAVPKAVDDSPVVGAAEETGVSGDTATDTVAEGSGPEGGVETGVAAVPEATPDVAPPSRRPSLELRLHGDSWVEITDARGQNLLRGLLREGEVRRVVGEPPFSVFLGNTDAVRLRYGEREIDPSPWRRRNATARFQIGD